MTTDCAAILQTSWHAGVPAQMVCDQCALAWDETDDLRPPCQRLTFGRMTAALEYQAEQIERSQRLLVAHQDRVNSHTGELERAQLIRACIRLIEKCRDDPAIAAILRPKKTAAAKQEEQEATG